MRFLYVYNYENVPSTSGKYKAYLQCMMTNTQFENLLYCEIGPLFTEHSENVDLIIYVMAGTDPQCNILHCFL